MPKSVNSNTSTVGDLVACKFPFAEGAHKTRICAVVAVCPETDEVVLAYGTGNLRFKADVTHALTVFREADCQAAGLHKPTRFQVDRRIRLSGNDPRFRVHRTKGTAKVGQLNPAMTARLREIYRRMPPVCAAKERQGIHPTGPVPRRRPGFFGRPRVVVRALASAPPHRPSEA